MSNQTIKSEFFNLGNPEDRKRYENILQSQDDGKLFILKDETEKSWGKKNEASLFIFLVYKETDEY